MENPVQEIIIGNIPGALGAEVVTTHHTDEVRQCVNNTTHDDQWTHKPVPGLDMGPDELKEKQKVDPTLKKYWELADKPVMAINSNLSQRKVFYTESIVGKTTQTI